MKLPELPDPVHHIMSDGACIGYYSDAQMQAYARQAAEAMREACAAECMHESQDNTRFEFAAAIRALEIEE